jgi:hypothetical protein
LPALSRYLSLCEKKRVFSLARISGPRLFAANARRPGEGNDMPEGLWKLIIFGAFGFFVCAAFTGWVYG